jgi:hypothetical protein
LTLRGLGYSSHPNIEVGNMVALAAEDWAHIYCIVETSRQVDDALYERFKAFIQQQATESVPVSMPDLIGPRKTYTIASLPATETPPKLATFYEDTASPQHTPEDIRRGMHDLVIFDMPSSLSPAEFNLRLGEAFRKTPFVRDFVDYLTTEKSLRFGSVNDWIHRKCEDGLATKKRTQNLCNSLVNCFGFRSQWANDSRANCAGVGGCKTLQ